ncbi:MAG: acetyl-coenzyme A synthetase N-terminal domain-containing protein, partial [Lentimicrobiaceae bacterium]|nr:acetyl-coenzyme A synthetase N-terminal domain-containing protein [Lentimicrobiaceae bacterium]
MEKPTNNLKTVYEPSREVTEQAIIKDYESLYAASIANPEAFWAKESENLEWYKKWDKVLEAS